MSAEAARKQEDEALWELRFGARPLAGGGVEFRVWGPLVESLAVRVPGVSPRDFPLERDEDDVFSVEVSELGAGADYFYLVDGERERPDPVSRWQPAGVHGPSRVVAPDEFQWTDGAWKGIPLKEYAIYELHTGTFTPEGTFAGVIPKLPYLKELGITAVEIMPVAEFPGGRNWGYDGTHLYAPQSTYGGPQGLKQLIDACHAEGLAVVLDVVYNHFGPEGNYLGEYAPIFNPAYHSPWGDALNFDNAESDGVRRFFVDNALYWLTEYHVDALRLDAVHAIVDLSPRHILAEISDAFRAQAQRLGRMAWTIGESDLNDVRVIKPTRAGGYGLDAQWSDDFHHSLHSIITGIDRGYFMDFGGVGDLAKAVAEGFVYDGRRSRFRKRRHGTSSLEHPGEQFVICIQNHDQIANGYWGDRLSSHATLEQHKVAAALMFAAPNVPMLFMGQEWGETAPFLYFTSHTDKDLAAAVRQGRKEEYASFVKEEGETISAVGGFANPQAVETFEQSKLVWSRLDESPHAETLRFYRDMLALRRKHSCLSNCAKDLTRVACDEERRWLAIERSDEDGSFAVLLANLSDGAQGVPFPPHLTERAWRLALWSGAPEYGGSAELAAPPAELSVVNSAPQQPQSVRLSGWNAALYVSEGKTKPLCTESAEVVLRTESPAIPR